jgi:hypothetical protein
MNKNPYASPKTSGTNVDQWQHKSRWQSPTSIILCVVGTCFFLLLDGQVFRNSLVFLVCWSLSLIIWLRELWNSRHDPEPKILVAFGVHVVAITFVCMGLPSNYAYQKGFNENVTRVREMKGTTGK